MSRQGDSARAMLAAHLAVVAISLAISTRPLSASAGDIQPFTVADSIAMTRLTDPDPASLTHYRPTFKLSPDGRKFAVVTMRGNLTTGRNEYALVLFDTSEVLRFLRLQRGDSLPRPDVLLRMETSRHRYAGDHAIDQLRWLPDGVTLAFVGRDARDIRQAFALDIESRQIRQLTSHPDDVAMFDVSLRDDSVVFAAWTAPDWTMRNLHGYAVRSNWMHDLARKDPRDATAEVRYFVGRASSVTTVAIDVAPGILPRVVSLSPRARWAVIFAQIQGIPSHWHGYDLLSEAMQRAQAAIACRHDTASGIAPREPSIDQDAFGSTSPWLGQFVLVDMRTGDTRPLLDAPASLGALAKAIWSEDEKTVVLARSFLPLDVSDDAERARRKRFQAIVEVDVETRAVKRLTDTPDAAPDGRRTRVIGIDRLGDHDLLITESLADQQQLAPRRFRRKNGHWVEEGSAELYESTLVLSVSQDMNSPPEIVATNTTTGDRRAITSLNPQFQKLALGRAEGFSWNDRFGRHFTGGLVRPPNFQKARRYPLVLQASAFPFRFDVFLVDGFGWMTSAFAARPLANRDMLVLQMPIAGEIRTAGGFGGAIASQASWDEDGEAPRFTAMMEGAIDALAEAGLVDRSRVGLIGFSRTGMHVEHAITFSRYPLAAATIADGMTATPSGQTRVFGTPYPGMLEWEHESFMGAPFWGEAIKLWLDRSPLFHLDRIRTPLRIEAYGIGIPAQWDAFALMKRQQRPVELIHIPLGHHVLVTPFSRLTSQQGNVDWFAFWLKGEEDSDPTKIEQYARWRKLRTLHEANLENISAAERKK